jgi:crotonobetainyl-CoA:carnitine CoA-transferase CaiB-like acyl-CoA transferase
MAGKPAYDATIQALGGGMSLTGTGKETEPPVRFGNPIGGIAGALYAVTGILAALARRRRTAAGATLDISLLDSQLALHAYRVPPALGAGVRYGPTPHRGGSGALPYGPFRARCGRWFALGITNQFWPAFCNLAGHPKWISDPRFASEALRQANEQALNRAVGETIATRDAEDWQERFIEAGIPGATVRSIPEAFRHPHVAERRMLVSFDHPLGSRLKVAGNPIKLSRHADARFSPAPSLGADTRRVLQDLLDMKSDELDQFCHDRVIWWPEHGEVYERPSVV